LLPYAFYVRVLLFTIDFRLSTSDFSLPPAVVQYLSPIFAGVENPQLTTACFYNPYQNFKA
ncbi:MAG: hypothetical protein LH478_09675, partial [Chitinophagaceae bacterium]|nr:hypothetical protein [Chitinophagaceae bacterium]